MAINNANVIGRLTKDPELKTTQTGKDVVTFTLAVDRDFSREKKEAAKAAGEQTADYLQIVAWNQLAQIVSRYCRSGSQIAVDGRIQSRSYDGNDGRKVYVTEIKADNIQLLDSKKEASQTYDYNTTSSDLTGTSNAKKEPMRDQIQFDYGTRSRNDTVKLGEIEAQNLSGDDLPF